MAQSKSRIDVAESPINFMRTSVALAEYDQAHDRTNRDLTEENLGKENKAANAVREAFYLDTADRNSRENCMLLGVGPPGADRGRFVRDAVRKWRSTPQGKLNG